MLKIIQFRELEEQDSHKKKGNDYRIKGPEAVFAKETAARLKKGKVDKH